MYDSKIQLLHILLPKTRLYVKSYGQTKWLYFLIKNIDLLEKHMSVLILKKNLIANLSTVNIFETKIKSYNDEVTDFHNTKIPR